MQHEQHNAGEQMSAEQMSADHKSADVVGGGQGERDEELDANLEEGQDDGPEAEGRLADVRVLIVDDDRDILESFEAAFQSEGALTLTASDGNEAVLLCQNERPDLVILDMMLPKRSGFLVLERIKGTEESPLVVMVTANEGKRHMAYAQSLGVDAYVQKPVPLARLIDVAVELLERE